MSVELSGAWCPNLDRRHPSSLLRDPAVADGVHASMDPVKPARGSAIAQHPVRVAPVLELPGRDHAVLPHRQTSKLTIAWSLELVILISSIVLGAHPASLTRNSSQVGDSE